MDRPKSAMPIPSDAKRVFKGVIFDVLQWQQEMYDGTFEVYEKLQRADTASVVAVTDDNKIIVLDEKQVAKDKFTSIPAGRLEINESPEEGALRELLEETGYKPKELHLWHAEQPSPKIEGVDFIFIAKGCKKVAEQKLDNGEKIDVKVVDFDQFVEMAINNQLRNIFLTLTFLKAKLDPKLMAEIKGLLLN